MNSFDMSIIFTIYVALVVLIIHTLCYATNTIQLLEKHAASLENEIEHYKFLIKLLKKELYSAITDKGTCIKSDILKGVKIE